MQISQDANFANWDIQEKGSGKNMVHFVGLSEALDDVLALSILLNGYIEGLLNMWDCVTTKQISIGLGRTRTWKKHAVFL